MTTPDASPAPQTGEQHADDNDPRPTVPDAEEPPQDTAPDPSEDTTDPDDADEDSTDPAKREAIRYRRRLREAEAQRDALAERVAGLTRTIVADIVATEISPDAFFLAGHEPSEFIAEDGTVRRTELDAAVAEVAKRLELRMRSRTGDPGQGARGVPPKPPELRDAFRPVR